MVYLKHTMHYALCYQGGEASDMLVGYCDADYATDTDDRRSVTAFVFKMAGAAVSWASMKQECVACSTTEAEYYAGYEAAKEAQYLRGIFEHLGGDVGKPTIIYGDNQGALALTDNTAWHKRTRHIDVRYHKVRELVASHVDAFTLLTQQTSKLTCSQRVD